MANMRPHAKAIVLSWMQLIAQSALPMPDDVSPTPALLTSCSTPTKKATEDDAIHDKYMMRKDRNVVAPVCTVRAACEAELAKYETMIQLPLEADPLAFWRPLRYVRCLIPPPHCSFFSSFFVFSDVLCRVCGYWLVDIFRHQLARRHPSVRLVPRARSQLLNATVCSLSGSPLSSSASKMRCWISPSVNFSHCPKSDQS